MNDENVAIAQCELLKPLVNLASQFPIPDPCTRLLQTVVALRQIEDRAHETHFPVNWPHVIAYAESLIDIASSLEWRRTEPEPTLTRFCAFLRHRAQHLIAQPAADVRPPNGARSRRRPQTCRKSAGRPRQPKIQFACKRGGPRARKPQFACKSTERRPPPNI